MELRNKIFAGAAATALTVANMLPFNDAAADEANTIAGRPAAVTEHQDLAMLGHTESSYKISTAAITVPYFDFREHSKEVAQTAASRASKNAIAVTLFGEDVGKFNAIQKAILNLNEAGWPVGLVLGPGDADNSEVYIHVNGQRVFPREGVRGTMPAYPQFIQDSIINSFNEYKASLRPGEMVSMTNE